MVDKRTDNQTKVNKSHTRRWFEEVWNQGRAESIDELLAPHAFVRGLGEAQSGLGAREYFRTFYNVFREALSGIHIDVEDVIGEGDRTAARLSVRARHTGHGLGVPPSGADVGFTGICFLRWENGRIVEGWNEYDAAGLMRQIGAEGK